MVDQDSVAGFHSSAARTAAATLLNPAPLVPWVTRTCPSARIVALSCRLAKAIPATPRQDGDAWKIAVLAFTSLPQK